MGRTAAAKNDDDPSETFGNALETMIGYNLKRAYMIIRSEFLAAQGDDPLSPRAFSALALTVSHPGLTQSTLARALGIERSGLVAITDTLERNGYLKRMPVPDDRRVQALYPTKAGKIRFAEAKAAIDANEKRLMSVLSETEQHQLLSMLQKFRNSQTGEKS